MKKIISLFLKSLLLITAFFSAVWFFVPWRQVGETILTVASEQLQKTYGIGVCEENGITLAVIPFGRENGTGTDHLLTQKRLKGEAPAGLILAEADGTFLKKYYGRK